jgi:hypothetical protein
VQAAEQFSNVAPDESVGLSFDFASYLSPGDSLASVTSWTCTVAEQSLEPDASPSSRLSGSPTTSGTLVIQRVQGCLANVTYVMEALVQTVNGETLSLWQYIDCIPVGQGSP